MFESLDEQMRVDDHKAVSNRERMVRWTLIILVSLLVFGGLYFGMHMMQGS